MIRRHIEAVHQDTRFSGAIFVPLIENNNNKSFAEIAYNLIKTHFTTRGPENHRSIYTHLEANGFPGCWQTNHTKECATSEIYSLIRDARLSVSTNFLGTHPSGEKATLTALTDQMKQMRRVQAARGPSADPNFAKDRYTISGKSGNQKDDLILALMTGIHWSSKLRSDPDFTQYLSKHGVSTASLRLI